MTFRKVIEEYSIEEILEKYKACPKGKRHSDGFIKLGKYRVKINKNSKFKLFSTEPTICKKCGSVATKFCLEYNDETYYNKVLNKEDMLAELNLYGIDKDGKDLLFTQDHIIPISKGELITYLICKFYAQTVIWVKGIIYKVCIISFTI